MESPQPLKDNSLLAAVDNYARRSPSKAVVYAFGVGFLTNLLPLGALAAFAVSLAFALAKPVLLFLGLTKMCEICRLNPSKRASHD